jgi:soluble lytic murein transglycosylase-like protein
VHVSGTSSHWDQAIARAGHRYSVDPSLVKAVIHVESLFDTTAVSPKGALGLMQLMPRTAALVGVDDAFDPWQNIRGGTRYLGYLLKRFKGDLELSLAAYNAGESTVRRYGGMPPYRETRSYVKRVLDLHRRYDADFR